MAAAGVGGGGGRGGVVAGRGSNGHIEQLRWRFQWFWALGWAGAAVAGGWGLRRRLGAAGATGAAAAGAAAAAAGGWRLVAVGGGWWRWRRGRRLAVRG